MPFNPDCPFDRQEDFGETRRAHAAFLDYCHMGPGRSLRKLAESYAEAAREAREAPKAAKQQRSDSEETAVERPPSLNPRRMFAWSTRFDWQERVDLWDRKLELERRQAEAQAVAEMAKRHVNLALAVQNVIADKLALLTGSDISVTEMARLLELAVELERSARGQQSEVSISVKGATGANISLREVVVELPSEPAG